MAKSDTFTFNADLSPEEWKPLPRAFKKGEQVRRFKGHDYGCTADDARYGGFETIACCETQDGPFFTVPVDFFVERPRGPYALVATQTLVDRGLKLPDPA